MVIIFSRLRNVIGFEISVTVLHSQLGDYTSKERCKVKKISVDMLEIQDAFGSARRAY